jgi:hypothetical protein
MRPPGVRIYRDQFVQIGIPTQKAGSSLAHDPRQPGLGVGTPERCGGWQCVQDVAYGTQLDDQDPFKLVAWGHVLWFIP